MLQIKLQCVDCGQTLEGISEIPHDWLAIELAPIVAAGQQLDWLKNLSVGSSTHVGSCPECIAQHRNDFRKLMCEVEREEAK